MRDDHIEEGIGNLKSLVADGRKVDSIAILLQFIKVSDDVVSSLAVVRQSLRLCASMVLKSSSLFHISWAVSVSHPTISTGSDCVTFQGNEDPREIAVSSPILRAFQVDVGNRAWDVIKMTCLPHYANL